MLQFDRISVMHEAVRKGHADLVKLLLDDGTDINADKRVNIYNKFLV